MSLSQETLAESLSMPFRFFERVGSTNDVAKDWLADGAPDCAVVIADEQLAGRGRRHRRLWHNPPGVALALSTILRPKADCLPRVTMLGGLAVCELAEGLGCGDIGIKWHNDVQIAGKKVSGILTEAFWSGEQLQGVVLGIGVNVRVDFTGTALENTAISLETALGNRLSRVQLASQLMERICYWYRNIDSDALFDAWRGRLNMLNRRVVANGVAGTALDVRSDGALLLLDDAGQRHVIYAGDLALGQTTGSAP